jgi:hypothetical protein
MCLCDMYRTHTCLNGTQLRHVHRAVLTACLRDMYRTHTCLCVHAFMCVVYTFVCSYAHTYTHLFICSCVYVCMYAHTHTLATHVHYSHFLKGRQGYTSVYVCSVSYSYTYTCNTCSLFPSSERKTGVHKCIRACAHMLTHTHWFICSCVYVCSVYIRVSICSHIHTCLYTHVLGWVCIAHTHTCLYNHVFMRVSIITPTLVPRSKVHPFSCAHMFP